MSNDVAVTSNVSGKLKKIVEGVVYSDPLVFITELLQNSYRAKAKNFNIKHYNDTLTFYDDGCGLKKITDLLTLDYSSWDTTDEGYGIGFWSILAIPNLETVIVKSKKWIITINVSEMLISNIPSAKVEECEVFYDGFSIELKSQYIDEYAEAIKDRVFEDGEFMEFNVYYNDYKIDKKDLFEEVDGDYTKEFHNRMFDAKLSINEYSYMQPTLYYEKRKVDTIYCTGYVEGVIEMKKKSLNLREPDRKAYTRDEKYIEFKHKLEECIKDLYLEYVIKSEQKDIDKYADAIDQILDVADYEKYLLIDDEIILETTSERDVGYAAETITKAKAFETLINYVSTISEKNQLSIFEENMTEKDKNNINYLLNKILDTNDKNIWVCTGETEPDTSIWAYEVTEDDINNAEVIIINGIRYEKRLKEDDTENYEEEDSEKINEVFFTDKKKVKETVKLIDKIKKYRRKVWVLASEQDEYSELIAKAEYYKVKVLIAKNILYENVFKKHNIPHILELKNGLKRKTAKKNIALKTGKEETFIKLLQPICQYYKLPYNTFRIANISMIVETILNDKIIDREIIENKKEQIKICGIQEGEHIYLDRRALGLNRFNITGDKYGINELKAIFSNITTIAHELAHLLYGTEDNTVEHLKASIELEEEICKILMTL